MKFILLFMTLLLLEINGYAQWEAERKLSTTDSACTLNENMGQSLAVSGDYVYAVWWVKNNIKTDVYFRCSSDGGSTWKPEIKLTNSGYCSFPSVSAYGSTVHVAYRDTTKSDYFSYYIRSTDYGATWEQPVSLGAYYWWPSITSDSQKVFVALNSNAPGNSEVDFRRSTDNGSTWDSVVHISNAPNRSEDPTIVVGGGHVHIAWNDNRTDTMQSFYRLSTDNGVTWGQETQLSHTTTFAYCPKLNVFENFVDLVWADRRSGNNNIYHRWSSDYGVTWTVEKPITSGSNNYIYPSLIRKDNDLHLVWWGSGIFYMHSGNAGISWDSTIQIVPGSYKPWMIFIALSDTVLHFLWADSRTGTQAIYYKRYFLGKNSGSSVNQEIRNQPFSIKIIPNPNTENSMIQLNTAKSCYAYVSIINLMGEPIADFGMIYINEKTRNLKWDGKDSNGNPLSPGLYFIKIVSDSGIFSEKFIIIK